MRVKSGAGAAVASGADYQSRIAAYFIALDFVDFGNSITNNLKIKTIGFETNEHVDDINIELVNSDKIYIQSKFNIEYSLKTGGNLRSVLAQFESQYRSDGSSNQKFVLIAGNASSKTITQTMKSALRAFKISPIAQFRRDQPNSILDIIKDLTNTLIDIRKANFRSFDEKTINSILKMMEIVNLDLEPESSLETSSIQLLGSAGYSIPTTIWGKLISDCLHFSKVRSTIKVIDLFSEYEKFKIPRDLNQSSITEDAIRATFNEAKFNVGRDVALVLFPDEGEFLTGMVILETYRFSKDCNERSTFNGDICRLLNGQEVKLFRRAATYKGLMRIIEEQDQFFKGKKITFAPINSKEDFESGPCADLHRERIKQAFASNVTPLKCLHCGDAVFSISAQIIEHGPADDIEVGLCHFDCIRPDDRVLGSISNELFENYQELVNFDVNGWARSAEKGPIGYAGLDIFGSKNIALTWSGHRRETYNGRYIVEVLLEDSKSRYATHRGRLQRFTSAHADTFAASLNARALSNDPDPFCYSSESWEFGSRSILMSRLGGKEKILKMIGARKVKYDLHIDRAYSSDNYWFAPICYLRNKFTEEPLTLLSAVPLIRNPWNLRNFLDNWRASGVNISEYTVETLLDDDKVDVFFLKVFDDGLIPIIDPLLVVDNQTRFASGSEIIMVPDPS